MMVEPLQQFIGKAPPALLEQKAAKRRQRRALSAETKTRKTIDKARRQAVAPDDTAPPAIPLERLHEALRLLDEELIGAPRDMYESARQTLIDVHEGRLPPEAWVEVRLELSEWRRANRPPEPKSWWDRRKPVYENEWSEGW
jgi:hypothetical protein